MNDPATTVGSDHAAANCLRIDHATVEAVQALRRDGVRPLLLKGPVITDWLYAGDHTRRAYNDIDLLVAPDDLRRARRTLEEIGYEVTTPAGLDLCHPRHAECWFRETDRAAVDLHSSIHGAERVDPHSVWAAAVADAGSMDLLGTSVEVPGEAFRLAHITMHLRPKDRHGTRAWHDLEVAATTVPIERWRDAVSVARSLDMHDLMGPILRLVEPGERLADRLELPERTPLHVRLEYGRIAPPIVAELLRAGWRQRLRIAASWLVPPPDELRAHWPRASRGPLGLVVVYVGRPVMVPWRLVDRWRRARRAG